MHKIAFVIDTMHPGGSERVISVLANGLSRKGLLVDIICLRGVESFYSLDNEVNIIFVEKLIKQSSFYKKGIFLRSYIKNNAIDVVIPFMTGVYCFTLLFLLGAGKSIICSERIDPTKTPMFRKFLRTLLLPTASYLVVQTELIKSYYPGFIQKKCSVIYNPVSDSFFEDISIIPKKRFINVGRLTSQKNHRLLIDAFKTVLQKYPDYILSIYGEGPLESELKDFISSSHLDNSVFLEGTTTNICEELKSSYAFCLSSDFEGMSNAMIEALCAGIPLISTNVSGATELLGKNEGGLIVPVRDTKAYTEAMFKLIESPDLTEEMRRYNLKKREEFRTGEIVDKWIKIINRFL